jgi:methionyl-tRNA synthetase
VLAEKPADADKLNSVLFHSAESLRLIAALLAPVMPQSAEAIWQQLGLDGKARDVRLNELEWSDVLANKPLRPGSALFPRIDSKEIYKKMDAAADKQTTSETPAAAAPAATGDYPPLAPMITIDDFAKIDLRVALVLEAERVKGADKLLRLVVDLGFEKRQILAGIAKSYEPESLVGRKVVVVANLQPRKLRGLESNGMIVAASIGPEERAMLAGFHEDVAPGARLK